ncbi:MAG: reverse transcriptase domain-containing protein, partial [Cetobacterium sp.]|uniref:reverse transcriptase domain-containing protein n=1 Tax=Cetobacterium sp. TaxID=2071632 RepID=UPI003EE75C8D
MSTEFPFSMLCRNEEPSLTQLVKNAHCLTPTINVCIEGKYDIPFIVDTGCTYTVIKRDELPQSVELSDLSQESIIANGKIVREVFTEPISVQIGNKTVNARLLVSDNCPWNLLGRDLMCKTGMTIDCAEGHGLSMRCFKEVVMTAYVWKWPQGNELVEKARERCSPRAQFMESELTHCTAHVSWILDEQYLKEWSSSSSDMLLALYIYWTDECCAVSIYLNDEISPLFDVPDSCPHVSLAKTEGGEWKDLGPFVKVCDEADDWRETQPGVFYSERAGAWRERVSVVRGCERAIETATAERAVTIDPRSLNVPTKLWAVDKYDVGLIKSCDPVQITPKSSFRPKKPQYPVKSDALEGITPVFESLLKRGIIIPCDDSPVNTPIFPVKKIRDKGQPAEWRFVQDLQAVNSAIHARAPNVPNPYTILSQIPPDTKFYTAVDISNAFFSVPVDKDSQFWFAFTFKGRRYTWTRLCQGYCESPTIYNDALRRSLEPLKLPEGVALLQYVDDLLLCAADEHVGLTATTALLRHLAAEGHKVNPSKVQVCVPEVTFLGHLLCGPEKRLSKKRIEAVGSIPKP